MKSVLIGLLLLVPMGGCVTAYSIEGIEWDMNCGQYLKNAADASTATIAIERLDKAITYLEADGATKGSTGVVFHTPTNDVSYWFNNIKAARGELEHVKPGVEETNALMKLRETLLDHGNSGDSLTAPSGIGAYGRNVMYFVLGFVVLIPGAIGGALIGKELFN